MISQDHCHLPAQLHGPQLSLEPCGLQPPPICSFLLAVCALVSAPCLGDASEHFESWVSLVMRQISPFPLGMCMVMHTLMCSQINWRLLQAPMGAQHPCWGTSADGKPTGWVNTTKANSHSYPVLMMETKQNKGTQPVLLRSPQRDGSSEERLSWAFLISAQYTGGQAHILQSGHAEQGFLGLLLRSYHAVGLW